MNTKLVSDKKIEKLLLLAIHHGKLSEDEIIENVAKALSVDKKRVAKLIEQLDF